MKLKNDFLKFIEFEICVIPHDERYQNNFNNNKNFQYFKQSISE